MLIEKMSVGDGVRKMKDKRTEDKIKSIGAIEKIDLMAPFRRKYAWYFEIRDKEASMNRSLKIRNTAFKSLILLDPSQSVLGGNSSL